MAPGLAAVGMVLVSLGWGWGLGLLGGGALIATRGWIERREAWAVAVPEFPRPPFWRSLRVYRWKFTHFIGAVYLSVFALGLFIATGFAWRFSPAEAPWLAGAGLLCAGLAAGLIAWMRHSDRTGAYLMGWTVPKPRGMFNAPR